jgi:hypothetical protein
VPLSRRTLASAAGPRTGLPVRIFPLVVLKINPVGVFPRRVPCWHLLAATLRVGASARDVTFVRVAELKIAQRIAARDVPTPERRAGCCTVAVAREHSTPAVASRAGALCQLPPGNTCTGPAVRIFPLVVVKINPVRVSPRSLAPPDPVRVFP